MINLGEDVFVDLFGSLQSRSTLQRVCPLVADALDQAFSNRIATERGKTFHGIGFITDGASLSGDKWGGLHFQITIAVAIFIPTADEWENSTYDHSPPFNAERRLCDVMHIPNKRGSTLFQQILPKQMARLG